MNLQQLMKIDFNPRNKHRLLALGYATAVTFAFILSLTNNNSVNASVSRTDKFDYIMMENSIQNGVAGAETIYPESSVENIKSLYEMVNYGNREKTVESEIEISKGDTLISILSDLGLEYNEAHDIYLKLKKLYDPRSLRVGQKISVQRRSTAGRIRFSPLTILPLRRASANVMLLRKTRQRNMWRVSNRTN